MSAFSAGVAALFADPHLSVSALYRVGGAGAGSAVRVIRSMPDETTNFASARLVVETVLIDVRVADAPDLAEGDTFEIASEVFIIVGAPKRDEDRLAWRAEARAA